MSEITAPSASPGPAPLPETAPPSSPAQKDRIRLLDAARGLGVLGILPCNMPDFAYSLSLGESLRAWPHGVGWATLTGWAVTQIFFQRRFVSLFSMMFGVSIFLVGGERLDKLRGLILRKRLLVLLAIGLVHCFAVWWGDILVSYALGGFVMLLLRSMKPRKLMTIGLTIWIIVSALYALGAIAQSAPPTHPPDLAKAIAQGAKDIAAYRSGFMGSLIANARDGLQAQLGQIFIVPVSVALMCIGLAAYKWGVFTGEASRGTYMALLGGGLTALVVIGVGYGAFLNSGLNRAAEAPGVWAQTALAPLNSFAYVAILFFALRSKLWRFIPNALAPVGQMAFTNYLTQSIMMTALFYGGRGPGLYGSIDRPGLWAICIAVWVLQLIWSRIWLTYFTMGPLEWFWRRLYRGPAPFLRARPGSPLLTAAI